MTRAGGGIAGEARRARGIQIAGGRADIGLDQVAARLYAPVSLSVLPHNVMGTPALSLSLAKGESGLPMGVQPAGAPSMEHLLPPSGAALEEALPWKDRVPAIHVSRTAAAA